MNGPWMQKKLNFWPNLEQSGKRKYNQIILNENNDFFFKKWKLGNEVWIRSLLAFEEDR